MLAGWIHEGVSLRGVGEASSSNRNPEAKPSLECFCVPLAVKGQIHQEAAGLSGDGQREAKGQSCPDRVVGSRLCHPTSSC